MQQRMDEMQRKYEEELMVLRDEKDAIRQQRDGKDLMLSTPTFSVSLKESRIELLNGREDQPQPSRVELNERTWKEPTLPERWKINIKGMFPFTFETLETSLPVYARASRSMVEREMWTTICGSSRTR